MDGLVKAFRSTLSINALERQQAESLLSKWAGEPSFLPSLLSLCASSAPGIDINVRLSAATYFKNAIVNAWPPTNTVQPALQIIPSARQEIMKLIVPSIVSTVEQIRRILSDGLKVIADQEWPERWPGLLEQVFPIIGEYDVNPQRALGAAQCVHVICRRYQDMTTDVRNQRRWPIHRVAELAFGPMAQLLAKLIQGPQVQHSIEMQTLIVKIFRCCVEEETPPVLYRSPASVNVWIQMLVAILEKDIPANVQPQDPSKRPKFCWWVLKKWAAKVLYRVGRKMVAADCRIPPKEPSDDIIAYEAGEIEPQAWAQYRESMRLKKEYCKHFETNLLRPVFHCELKLFGTLNAGAYIAPRVLTNMIGFLDFAISHPVLWRDLEPAIDGFLSNVLFKLTLMHPDHRAMFFEEPVDFINLVTEGDKMHYVVNMNALYLLKNIMSTHEKPRMLDAFMKFLSDRLGAYGQTRDWVEKEAVLACLGTLSDHLIDNKKYGPALEGLLVHHVFPEITGSPQGNPLEWRALWTAGKFWSIRWTNPGVALEASKCIVNCLKSPHLPIKLMAAGVLPWMAKIPPVAEAVERILPQIVQQIISMSRQIDSEQIMASLDMLVQSYPRQMSALSLQLIPLVIQSFKHAASETGEAASMAGFSALELLTNIVDECADHTKDPQAWQQLEALLVPFALDLLALDDRTEFWELGLKIMCAITFEPPFPNSPQAWTSLNALYKSWTLWAKDYMVEIWELWDNFPSNAPDTFLANPDYVRATMEIITYGLRKDSDIDQIGGALKMFETLVCNFRGRIDNLIPPLMTVLFQKMKWSKEEDDQETLMATAVRGALFFWYNPQVCLGLMEQNGVTVALLQTLVSLFELMTQKKEKKMAILGLSSLFYLPPQAFPQSVKSRFPQLVYTVLEMQMELWQQRDEEEALKMKQQAGGDDEDDEGGFETGNLGWARPSTRDGDDGNDDDDDAGAMMHRGLGRLGADEEGGFDDFADQMALLDEEGQSQALEKLDEVLYWYEGVMRFHQAGGAEVFGLAMRSGKSDHREWHAKLVKLAEEKRKDAAMK